MSLISWALFGAAVGGIAKSIMPGVAPQGWLPCIAIGVAGSIVGGLPFGEGPTGLVGSIIGAVVLLYAWSVMGGNHG